MNDGLERLIWCFNAEDHVVYYRYDPSDFFDNTCVVREIEENFCDGGSIRPVAHLENNDIITLDDKDIWLHFFVVLYQDNWKLYKGAKPS